MGVVANSTGEDIDLDNAGAAAGAHVVCERARGAVSGCGGGRTLDILFAV